MLGGVQFSGGESLSEFVKIPFKEVPFAIFVPDTTVSM